MFVRTSIRLTLRVPGGGSGTWIVSHSGSRRKIAPAGRPSTVTLTSIGRESSAVNVVAIGMSIAAAPAGTKNDACPPDHRYRRPSVCSQPRRPDDMSSSHAGSRKYHSTPISAIPSNELVTTLFIAAAPTDHRTSGDQEVSL